MKEIQKKEVSKRNVHFSEIATPLFIMLSALCLFLIVLLDYLFSGECVGGIFVFVLVLISLVLGGLILVSSPYYKKKDVQSEQGTSINMKKKVTELSSRYNLISGIIALIAAVVIFVTYLVDDSLVGSVMLVVVGLLFIISLIYLLIRAFSGVKSKTESQITIKEGQRSLTPLIIYIQKAMQDGKSEAMIREMLSKTKYTPEEIDKAITIAKPIEKVQDVAIVKNFGTKVSEEALRLEEVTKSLEKRIKGLKKR